MWILKSARLGRAMGSSVGGLSDREVALDELVADGAKRLFHTATHAEGRRAELRGRGCEPDMAGLDLGALLEEFLKHSEKLPCGLIVFPAAPEAEVLLAAWKHLVALGCLTLRPIPGHGDGNAIAIVHVAIKALQAEESNADFAGARTLCAVKHLVDVGDLFVDLHESFGELVCVRIQALTPVLRLAGLLGWDGKRAIDAGLAIGRRVGVVF